MKIFVADSLTKVLREPEEGERPLREGSASLAACRNERESLQIVAVAGGQSCREVTAVVSDLQHEAGRAVISAARISVNPVGYVQTNMPAYPVERVGWWPDPLLPPAPVDVDPGHRQPFWITVHVPDSAAPGRYTGVVTVSADGAADQHVPLELAVWDFSLAASPPLPSAVAIYPNALSRFYNEEPVSEETLRRYWDMLFTHRLSSDDLGSPLGQGMSAVMDGTEAAPFDYETFDQRLRYCFRRGLTAFQMARIPGFLSDGPDLTEQQQERIIAYLKDFSGHLAENGWLERAFAMVWDEPRDQFAPQVLTELQTVRRADPRIRTRLDGPVTGSLVDACQEEVDIWGLHMLNIARGGPEAQANIARWRQQSRVLWMYVACDVHHPYPNIFIDYPLISCRVLPWLCWKHDIQGFLYWSANAWGEENLAGDRPEEKWPHRPWIAGNFVENWEGGRNEYNGDGHLIYPGPDGIPLSSIRLEALRDGMEDHEYMWLLERGIQTLEATASDPDLAAEARAYLENQPVAASFTEWCREPETLQSARRQLACLIVRVLQAGPF